MRASTGLSGPEAARVVRDARAVVAQEPVHQTLLTGAVHLEQAREITGLPSVPKCPFGSRFSTESIYGVRSTHTRGPKTCHS